MAKERRIRYGIVWVLFLLALFVGGGLLLGTSGRMQAVGLALILSPVAVFGFLLVVYYVKSRRDA